MDIRIHCLNTLCLLLLVCPGAVPSIISSALYGHIRHDSEKQKNSFWLFNVANLLLIIMLIYQQSNLCCGLEFDNIRFDISILFGFIAAPFLILVELIIGLGVVTIQKKRVKVFSVDEQIGKEKFWMQLLVLLVALLEEILFRNIGHTIIVSMMRQGVWEYLIITSVLYAINHLYQGFTTTVQKFATGCILSSMFIVTGYNILVPIAAHLFENTIIIVWSRVVHE